jgi:hypothetical protein
VKKIKVRHEQNDKIKDIINGSYLKYQLSNQIAKSTLEKVNLERESIQRM